MKVGIIGCGKIAERHTLALKKIGVQDIVCYDVDHRKAQSCAARYNIKHATTADEILNDPNVVAVNICTPTSTHPAYVVDGLRSGKHVFCEKPLAQTLDEALRIKKVADQTEQILMVGYLYRFFPALQFVKQVLDDGIIGNPYFAIFRLGGRGSHAAWKHQSEGGGAILEMLVHKLDLVYWYFGKIESFDQLWRTTLLPEREIGADKVQATAEDLVLLRVKSGQTQIICESDLISPSYMEYIEIHGENGSIFSSILHYLPTTVYCKSERGIFSKGHTFQTFQAINAHEKELEFFLDAIRGEKELINTVDDSIETIRLINQLNSVQ